MVVPMLAPMITHTAWRSVIMPEFTKPTTHYRGSRGGLYHSGDDTAHQHAQNGVGRKAFQNAFHPVASSGLQAGAHHLHPVQEEPQAAQQHQ